MSKATSTEEILKKMMNKDFTFYFFVVDSKNVPNGAMFYSYSLAKEIQGKGYNVKMLYQYENEDKSNKYRSFTGVEGWLGKDYSEGLEHINMNNEEVKFTSLDYIFIPLGIPSFLLELREHKVPSKTIMLCNNPITPLSTFDVGVTYDMYGFDELWCSSIGAHNVIKPLIKNGCNIKVVTCKTDEPIDMSLSDKKLSIGVYTNEEKEMKQLYNTFINMYPKYSFITFTPIRMFSHSDYLDIVRETPILVWLDDTSVSGKTLEEMSKYNNVLLAKRTEFISEGFSGRLMVWTDGIYELAIKLGSIVGSFIEGTVYDVEEDIKKSIEHRAEGLNVGEHIDELVAGVIVRLSNNAI